MAELSKVEADCVEKEAELSKGEEECFEVEAELSSFKADSGFEVTNLRIELLNPFFFSSEQSKQL